MKNFTLIFTCLFLLVSCTEEIVNLKHFTSPHGGTYAIRLPNQVKITENSFIYQVQITNVENEYTETKRFVFERMNFHPFTETFQQDQLEFLHFEYFTLPNEKKDEAYKFLSEWDNKITNNPTLFTVTNQLIFAICKNQQIASNKLVTTIFNRLNKDNKFTKIYDDMLPFKNTSKPIIAYQDFC